MHSQGSEFVFHGLKTNRARIYWYFLLATFILVDITMPFILTKDSSFLPMIALILAVTFTNLAIFHKLLFGLRLIANESGIEYQGLKYRVSSTWDDLQLSNNLKFLWFTLPARLTSKKPIVKRNFWFTWDWFSFERKMSRTIPFSPEDWDDWDQLISLVKIHRPDLSEAIGNE